MNLNTIQSRIVFYKQKIAICNKVKSMIPLDDPYRDIKISRMNKYIRTYKEEIARLKPGDLRQWN